MTDADSQVADSEIALTMAVGDQEGLRLFLQAYGRRIKAFLVKHYGHVLQRAEVAEAFNLAIYTIWRFADRYDESKGSLPSWSIRIAQRAAQTVLRRETRYRSKHLEYDAMYDPAEAESGSDAGTVAPAERSDDPRSDALYKAIDRLPPLQKAIVEADLAADGLANAQRLAEIHGTSKNSIYVSRGKAHKSLKKQAEQVSPGIASTRSQR